MTEASARPPVPYRTRWTIDEVLALPESGMRQELVAGRRVESPNPPNSHQWVAKQLMLIASTRPSWWGRDAEVAPVAEAWTGNEWVRSLRGTPMSATALGRALWGRL
ncbi:hypothetical protein GCM10023196_046680 [Actinoallomurus vinaceus]|uniref:Restriction endonuclease domain-containing protein n=1 Tax=Actinoallomurus vinaceus TaxID=1080074 RepID=A0ABP8UFD2_9ACTN